MSRAKELADALAHGDRSIGALVYWRELSGIRIPRDVFRTGFRACGLGGALAADPKPEATLNQAAGAASRKQERGEPKVKVELKSKGTHAVYAVLARRDEADGRVKYLEEATIAVHRENGGALIVNVPPSSPADDHRDDVIARVDAEYRDRRDYAHTQEVSETLVRSMSEMDALSLRPGVYYVPAAKMATVRMLREFIETNTSAYISTWDIRGSAENAAEAQRDAREVFVERISKLIDDVKEFTASTTVEDAAMKSINAKVRKFRELDGQVALYADILGDYQEELRKAIADARQSLLGAYIGDADDAAA